MTDSFIVAQISDTHMRSDDQGAAARQLRRALQGAAAYHADVILMTGDLANDEREDEYAVLAGLLADPPAPAYLLPGNHDSRDRLRAAFPRHTYLPRSGRLSFIVENFPVRIVALDQIAPGETYGEFSAELAHWLDRALRAAPDAPTLVAMHHPPFLSHDLLFDRIGLKGAERFEAVIAAHKQVQRIVAGHHHRVVLGQVAHAPVIIAPSTSWTYGLAAHPEQPIAPRTDEQPGWMLHIWKRGAGFASHFIGL